MADKQEAIVRSFLRKISPNRDWDYLGEHEHALIADLISDIAATLGSGTLTAEQVCEAIERHVKFYEDGDYDEQAIADELNAKLGSGTCKPVETETLENVTVHVMECDECGGTYEHVNGDYERCPHCGRKVVER